MKYNNFKILVIFMCMLTIFAFFPNNVEAADSEYKFYAGQENKLKFILIDTNKIPIALGAGVEEIEFNYYYNHKPDAQLFVEEADSLFKDLTQKGVTELIAYAEEPGEFDITVAFNIKYNQANKTDRIITKKLKLIFEEKIEKQDLVTMYINTLDYLTPFSAIMEDETIYLPLTNTFKVLGQDVEEYYDRIFAKQGGMQHLKEIQLPNNKSEYYISAQLLDDLLGIKTEKVCDEQGKLYAIKLYKLQNSK